MFFEEEDTILYEDLRKDDEWWVEYSKRRINELVSYIQEYDRDRITCTIEDYLEEYDC